MNETELIERAHQAAQHAYAPYSGFAVGAALLSSDGEVFTGCNIENGSFGATCCAERTAFFKAVSEGVYDFDAIAVVGGKDGDFTSACPPCGICRQVMAEFCTPDFKIILRDGKNVQTYTLSDLLPLTFSL